MVTNRRKARNRKKLFTKVGIIVALIVISVGSGYFIADKFFVKHGYISPLAKIPFIDKTTQEENDKEFLKTSLAKQHLEVEKIVIEQNIYKITIKNGPELLLSTKKDLNDQISSLQFILSRLTMEGKRVKSLDIRFDKPVVIFDK
jgi:hypothetical protein